MSKPSKIIHHQVGDLEVELDYEGMTVTVTRFGGAIPYFKTEDIGNGVLVDRGRDGKPWSVEFIAEGDRKS